MSEKIQVAAYYFTLCGLFVETMKAARAGVHYESGGVTEYDDGMQLFSLICFTIIPLSGCFFLSAQAEHMTVKWCAVLRKNG